MEFKERFSLLLDTQNVSMYRVSQETGIVQQLLANYKKGVSKPKHEKMCALANFFNVSEVWLRTGFGDIREGEDNEETERLLNAIAESEGTYEKMHKLIGIVPNPLALEMMKSLSEDMGYGDEVKKELLKKVEKPQTKEERLLAIIESQQRMLESQQETIKSLVSAKSS